ncbi:MAG: PepSY-associated TM helix domain-containing protein [Blastocatellia bacterium]|nr:PepSY-associated TM helix domain-containing protein [Blastocatellia bacterium]
MKRYFYLWHRYLGIAACAVVFVWSVSGFLHPLMSWTQPRPAKMMLPPTPLKAERLGIAPAEALTRNGLQRIRDFNVVSFDGQSYYQVKTADEAPLVYLNTRDGGLLANGDERYAIWLARQYLQEFDAPVMGVALVRDFDHEYKIINKLLPVYRVQFGRADGMRAYVDTSTGLLGTLNNNFKGRLLWLFSNLHNWDWLSFSDTARIAALVTFTIATMAMAISGLLVYGFFWRSFKPVTEKTRTTRNWLKQYHRRLGVTVSATMLLWSISAAYHAIEKPAIREEAKTRYAPQEFSPSDAAISLSQLLVSAPNQKPVTNISMVRVDGKPVYQIFRADRSVAYFDANSGAAMDGVDERYAREIANSFSGLKDAQIVSVKTISQFDQEYGFINKRLPVSRVEYNDANRTRYYVEPAAGVLSLKLGNRKRLESYSFNFLHKWHFLDWAGKKTRDVIMMIFVLLQAVVAGSGLWMFVLWKGAAGNRVSGKKTVTVNPAPPIATPIGSASAMSEAGHGKG